MNPTSESFLAAQLVDQLGAQQNENLYADSGLTKLMAEIRNRSKNEKDVGDHFEILVKWWLETDPEYKAKFVKVWHFSEWPQRWQDKDLGTDLIAEDDEGKFVAIQAKGYTLGSPITHTDMGKFIADSEKPIISYRLLITTTNAPSEYTNTAKVFSGLVEKPIYTVDRHNLEAPGGVTWPESITDLYAVQPAPKTPRPYQDDAIEDVIKGFEESDRGQLLMVSGTGKTLTGLFIKERLASQNTLVLLPSLMLLKQTLKVYRANSTVDFKSLPVGSDATANHFGIGVAVSTMGYPTTTNAVEIAKFLREDGVKVVFSTYQSSEEIAAAQALADVPDFDLAIADEAHNTAGSLGSYFATVLHKEKIRASRRLFMTATPRNFTPRVLQRAVEVGDERASMNDEARYGTVFHELPYAKALKLKLVTDYRVAIIGVKEEEIREWAENGHHVKINGLESDLRWLAGQVALLKAMREFDMSRVITFHNTVARARAFANTLPQALAWLPEDERPLGPLWARHIDGQMPGRARDLLLDQLGGHTQNQLKVLANAKVLTEGVDVPTLDGIAVLDPKRSPIAIYQSAGRSFRLDPENPDKVATIVIPVFVRADSDLDDAAILASSAFDTVWHELLAMRMLDERFAEWVDGFRLEKGKLPTGTNPSIPSSAQLETNLHEVFGDDFANSFMLKLVDMTTASWEEWFGILQKYVEEKGNALVPAAYETADGRKLGSWVNLQRTNKITNKATLTPERIDRLSKVAGWSWDVLTDKWEEGFNHLLDYVKAYGHALVPGLYRAADGYKLGSWVNSQRTNKVSNKATLTPERIDRLAKVARWEWDARAAAWEEGFNQLLDYVKKNGHARVPRTHIVGTYKLGQWVGLQRVYRGKSLSPEREARLSMLDGWEWDVKSAQWEEGFSYLLDYVKENGHALVPHSYEAGAYKLGAWVANQRVRRKILSDDRQSRLSTVKGWVWTVPNDAWEKGFAQLLKYIELNKHALVPAVYKTDEGYGLGAWVNAQRRAYATGDLTAGRIDRLSKLDEWVWKAQKGPPKKA